MKNIRVQDLLLAAMFLFLLYYISKCENISEVVIDKKRFGLFSLSMYIMPACLVAISAKYQKELSIGVGYIPVYLQYFGLLLVFFWIFLLVKSWLQKHIIKERYHKLAHGVFLVMLTSIILLNQQNARLYIENSYAYWLYPKQAVQNAMSIGILNDVQPVDSLTTLTQYAWDSSSFFSEFAKRKITYFPMEQLQSAEKGFYMIRYYGDKQDESVFLGKADENSDVSSSVINMIDCKMKCATLIG